MGVPSKPRPIKPILVFILYDSSHKYYLKNSSMVTIKEYIISIIIKYKEVSDGHIKKI